jgi:hypothetical protein
MQSPPYRQRVWKHTLSDWITFVHRSSLIVGLATAVTGILIAVWADWRVNEGAFSVSAWLAGLIGAIGGPFAVGIVVLVFYRLRAPRLLDEESADKLRIYAAKTNSLLANIELERTHYKAQVAFLEEHHKKELEREKNMTSPSWTPPVLEAQLLLDPISLAWPDSKPGTNRTNYLGQRFVLLRVRNKGDSRLALVARCLMAGPEGPEGNSLRCAWSLDSGEGAEDFISGGRHEAVLSAGDSRLLAIAQFVEDGPLWLSLQPRTPIPEIVTKVEGLVEGVRYCSKLGKVLNLGRQVKLKVRLKADGLAQTFDIDLGLDKDNNPTISVR